MTSAVEENPADAPAAERPIHLARCAECATAVKYQLTASGAGLILFEAAPDAIFGLSANGIPICPQGHGEMSIADETLKPAADAIAEALELQEAESGPTQRTLPGVFPAFNYQGAYLELEQQAVECDRLRREHEDDAKTSRESKKDWDEAEALYTKMALEFRRRRREKAGEPKDAADMSADINRQADREPCTWEAKHPGVTCALCSNEFIAAVVTRVLGQTVAPPDAVAHADDVERLLLHEDVDVTQQALENVDTYIDASVIATWSEAERAAVTAFAGALLDRANNVPDVVLPERPTILGKPHIPTQPQEGAMQVCALCEEVIAPNTDQHPAYEVTDYVGVDCAGKPAKVDHTYPTSKKKPSAAKAKKKR